MVCIYKYAKESHETWGHDIKNHIKKNHKLTYTKWPVNISVWNYCTINEY